MNNIMDEARRLSLMQELLFYRGDTDLMDEINQVTFPYTTKYKNFKKKQDERI